MKTIKDIRLYKSDKQNIDGNAIPTGNVGKKLNIIAWRITMKLREAGFSLGDFDHLYINFTTCEVSEGIAPAKRGVDTYHPWYRYYDAEVSEQLYNNMEENSDEVVSLLTAVLCRYFATDEFNADKIDACVREAVSQGENMLMLYKEKKGKNRYAVLYLRLNDNGRYSPLLRVWDMEGKKLLEADMPEILTLDSLGEIRLSNAKVAVLPKKNSFTKELAPIEFAI